MRRCKEIKKVVETRLIASLWQNIFRILIQAEKIVYVS
ncbi:hypothetical protein GXM_06995 [Nostoc sphaeroides CCNUC1]|uniref:Uncharacterized protein n=1 Tax=Nostoc sphaeroides CCNUC1 TaxID=2653204 RepID=A0A5P8WAC3_9NOSO|nr:hypothetical protein GXM_06995 [Nostoc sphaeroides CCNUC1]